MSNEWIDWLRSNSPRRFNMASKDGWHEFVNSAARQPLRRLNQLEYKFLAATERQDYDEARMVWHANPPTVQTAQLKHAFASIDQVMASNRRDGDRLRGSAVIDAAPALGKTTIVSRYAREFHRTAVRRYGAYTRDGHHRAPVAFIPLDAGITLKGLNQKLLDFYGHPAASRASRSRLGALAVDCVHSCETQLIVIDDLHFIDFKQRNGQEVSNHLKGLANEMPVTFIYVGVRLSERLFFAEGQIGDAGAHTQTSRRATRVPVSPFTLENDAGTRAWNKLLASIEKHLILMDHHEGDLVSFSKEIYRRTQGYFGSITNLIDRASYLAVSTGEERITPQIIRQVTIDNAAEQLSPA